MIPGDILIDGSLMAAAVTGLSLSVVLYRVHQVHRSLSGDDGEIRQLVRDATRAIYMIWGSGALLYLVTAGILTVVSSTYLAKDREIYVGTVAKRGAQQLSQSLQARAAQARLLAIALGNGNADGYIADPESRQRAERLLSAALVDNADIASVSVLSAAGEQLLRVGENGETNPTTVRTIRDGAMDTDRFDPARGANLRYKRPDQVRIEFAAAIPASPQGADGPTVLAMAIDPVVEVLPAVQHSYSAASITRTLVGAVIDDEIVFVSPREEIGGISATAGHGIPWRSSDLPIAQAYRTDRSSVYGIDDLGEPVLLSIARLPGSPWLVIAQAEMKLIDTPLIRMATIIVLLTGAMLLGITYLAAGAWSRRTVGVGTALADSKTRVANLRRHNLHLARLTRRAVLLIAPDGKIVEANAAAAAMYGIPANELVGSNAASLRAAREDARFLADWPATAASGGVVYERKHRRRDGSIFPVEIAAAGIEMNGQIYRRAVIDDLSERKFQESEIARLSRREKMLRATSEIFAVARSPQDLFQRIADMLVAIGGYRVARIAAPVDDEQKTVRTIAIAGDDQGYLAEAALVWADREQGLGPSGTALRDGQLQINQDFDTNPRMAPWRALALKRGFRSSIAIPLCVAGRTFGLLGVYCDRANAFDDDEVALLTGIGACLAAAIERSR